MSVTEKVILFGGGSLPDNGLDLFFRWNAEHGDKPTLIATWASEEPLETAAILKSRFRDFTDRPFLVSLEPPRSDRERARFLSQLSEAGAVFFSGGDQRRIARAFDHADVHGGLHSAYRLGVPFAGTSAGTAMMSELMITGDGDLGRMSSRGTPVRTGLGLVENVVFDQHFLRRQRQNRLFSVVMDHPHLLGIGVDEDTGLAVVGGRHAEVVGPERVMLVVSTNGKGALAVDVLEPGHSIDLWEAKPRFFVETQSA
jgi:cyanophycinase